MEITSEDLQKLNADSKKSRLEALGYLKTAGIQRHTGIYANNHIHTFYSFSPYSPTAAVYLAWKSGLCAAGIVDHDSVSGAVEFTEAGRILGLPTTIGCECRVDMSETRLSGRRMNNPDQISIAYAAMHAIPLEKLGVIDSFFAPRRALRNERNAMMCEKLSALTKPLGIGIDFESDVLPLSHADEGGSVTERHILFALVRKLLALSEPEKALRKLGLSFNPTGPFPEYSLLDALKANFVERFYIKATSECPPVAEFLELCESVGAIPTYAYLGDVPESSRGDKKPQRYEDGYLDELFAEITRLGFKAVACMPSRNTTAQLWRVSELCREYRLMEICGEDINSPDQSFLNSSPDKKASDKLTESTMNLIKRAK